MKDLKLLIILTTVFALFSCQNKEDTKPSTDPADDSDKTESEIKETEIILKTGTYNWDFQEMDEVIIDTTDVGRHFQEANGTMLISPLPSKYYPAGSGGLAFTPGISMSVGHSNTSVGLRDISCQIDTTPLSCGNITGFLSAMFPSYYNKTTYIIDSKMIYDALERLTYIVIQTRDTSGQIDPMLFFIATNFGGNTLVYGHVDIASIYPNAKDMKYSNLAISNDKIAIHVLVSDGIGGQQYKSLSLVFHKKHITNAPSKAPIFHGSIGDYSIPVTTTDSKESNIYTVGPSSASGGSESKLNVGYFSNAPNGKIRHKLIGQVESKYPWDPYLHPAEQKGSSTLINTGDRRMASAVFTNSALWCVQTVGFKKPDRTSIMWWQIDPGNISSTNLKSGVLQNGLIDNGNISSGTYFYSFPSIAVNKKDNVLINYSRVGAGSFIEGVYSVRTSTDPINQLRPERVFTPSTSGFGTKQNKEVKWMNYSSVGISPNNNTYFYPTQIFPVSPGTWKARVAQVEDFK